MLNIKFTKMHGTGNDFIIIDDRDEILREKEIDLALKLCNRRFGIGADGIIFLRFKDKIPYMRIINSDGSQANMCGNGIRCFAAYVFKNGIVKDDCMDIYTDDGLKRAFISEDLGRFNVTINMGKYSFKPEDIPALSEEKIIEKDITINGKNYTITSLLLGVPHTVIFLKDDIDISDGPFIENYSLFPKKTNVNFCKVVNEGELIVRTWERGAGATYSCGTGSCASVVCGNMLNLVKDEVKVLVKGGELNIKIKEEGVFMMGEAVFVFSGQFSKNI